jgi:hypothetical protein
MDLRGLNFFAERQARLLSALTESSGSVLIVEPGIPRSGEFISLLRLSLIEEGRKPLSPCAHSLACPLPGGRPKNSKDTGKSAKAKWCHFAFDTEDAPEELHRLSAASGIPKERAVLSFLLAGPVSSGVSGHRKTGARVKIRIISDSFPAGDTWGRYGCSERGLVLVTGSRKSLEVMPSGALGELPLAEGLVDAKSGALIARV